MNHNMGDSEPLHIEQTRNFDPDLWRPDNPDEVAMTWLYSTGDIFSNHTT
jgi:hypothetical protein